VGIANGNLNPQASQEAEITIRTSYRWRKECGGLNQAKRLKELEGEKAKFKRGVGGAVAGEAGSGGEIAEGNF
jgi:hypothetical protein